MSQTPSNATSARPPFDAEKLEHWRQHGYPHRNGVFPAEWEWLMVLAKEALAARSAASEKVQQHPICQIEGCEQLLQSLKRDSDQAELWRGVRIRAEGSDWKRGEETLAEWAWRKLAPVSARVAKDCQSGLADVCKASQRDGVVCPAESCDIDDGVRRDHDKHGEEIGRIPDLEPARRNAEYWTEAARHEPERASALTHLHQAVNAWKNAAYAMADQRDAARSAMGECAGPFVDAKDCPVHRKDTTPMTRRSAIEECAKALDELAEYAASQPHWSSDEHDGILLAAQEVRLLLDRGEYVQPRP